jgi:acyl-coenzyme A thioesterase PaaI-like protein
MKKVFDQISIRPTFMKFNGGLLFRKKSNNKYEFKTKVSKNHLNSVGITHGGYIATIIDSGAGTAAYRCSGSLKCVTVSLDIKFIGMTKLNDEITGSVSILKQTKSMVFISCSLKSKKKFIAYASGIWKILKR